MFQTKTDSGTVAKLERRVQYVMSLSEADMLSIVPAQSGIYFTDCPNCGKGTQDRGPFKWAPQRPTELVCRGCGARYPNNPKYPDDKILEVPGPHGPHRYPYYERPAGKYRILFRAHADYWAREYMADACRDLAALWWATRDERYAARAGAILLRFAEVYPGYAYHMDLPFRQKRFSPYTRNRVRGAGAFRTAKWSWWAYMDIPLELIEAYDCLRDWPGLQTMGDGKATAKIENDLLAAMVDFAFGFREPYHNMGPTLWRRGIYAGRVLRRPEYVHEMVRRFRTFTREHFLHDGHWKEAAPSYCSQVLHGLGSVTAALEGYQDPEGYVHPRTGERFDEVAIAGVQAVIGDLTRSLNAPRLPNGRLIPLNDTWSKSRRRKRRQTEPVLMPGLGVAVLGGGEGDGQVHMHLNFTAGRSHKHRDALSLGLFAFGKELLPDIGYTHTKWRAWTLSTLSHNTVAVDSRGSEHDPGHTGRRVRAYVTDRRGFHLAEAEALGAYPDRVSRYRRTLIAVGASAADTYVVDVFQVHGGQHHDYLLHGSADEDSTATVTGAAMAPFAGTLVPPGVTFELPEGEAFRASPDGAAYGFVRTLTAGAAQGTVVLDLRLDATPSVGTRTWLLTEPKTTVYLGQAPSLRRAKEADDRLARYQAPFFCARREGREGRQGEDLRSVFVAVHEPVSGKATVTAVSAKRLAKGVVVTVERGALGTDEIAVAYDRAGRLRSGALTVHGRYAVVRTRGGQVQEAHLVAGVLLRHGEFELIQEAGWAGAVKAVVRERGAGTRGYFDVGEAIPAQQVDAALALIVRHPDGTQHAYSLARVEALADGARLYVLEDPGFEITDRGVTRVVCAPTRTIQGVAHTYELLNAAHVRAGE